jgi:hypothetical protein
VHLDFHTSPHIPGVGSEFDAAAFADTMQRAHVNSATVFAKCHHGMCYYPTQTGVVHPGMESGRDLLGEQIEALHARGIRAPIYTTIVWEEDVAQKHPEWRQLTKEGYFADWGGKGPDGQSGHLGMWKFNNFLDPDYQDYFEAHVREICSRYGKEVDGFFFDILLMAPNAGWSEASRAFRAKHGLLADDKATHARFEGLAQAAFAEKFTKIVHGLRPKATIFYNAANDGNMDRSVGPRTRAASQTHNEVESLPSGMWGYYHFPRMARAQARWGKPWLSMTGRFQKMWGDFGGIKPQAALEFECFRSQALGGANSIGDQLPPRGTLDPVAYDLIGAVFGQCAEAEPFYEGAKLLDPEVGIFSASYAGYDGGKSEEGAVLICEESHYDCAVLDNFDELQSCKLLILPDSTVVDKALAKKLKAYHAKGGQLLISHKAGFDAEGNWALDFLSLKFEGTAEKYPTYWRAKKSFAPEMAASDRVFYAQGLNVKKSKGVKVLVERVLPYFKRSDIRYSSHFQTPPVAEADKYPAVVAGEGFVYFADPIFSEYRQTGNLAARDIWRKAMERLIGTPAIGHGLPTTMQVYPMRKGKDLLLTLLHYIPIRKSLDIDVIEERSSFAGELLRLPDAVESVEVGDTGECLNRNESGAYELPARKGRLLLKVAGFFA